MLIASDGNAYVVKFANNPQSPRVLVNEWLACSIGRALGLAILQPAILSVPAELVESSPSLVIHLSNPTLKCSHWAAGLAAPDCSAIGPAKSGNSSRRWSGRAAKGGYNNNTPFTCRRFRRASRR